MGQAKIRDADIHPNAGIQLSKLDGLESYVEGFFLYSDRVVGILVADASGQSETFSEPVEDLLVQALHENTEPVQVEINGPVQANSWTLFPGEKTSFPVKEIDSLHAKTSAGTATVQFRGYRR